MKIKHIFQTIKQFPVFSKGKYLGYLNSYV